MCPWDTCKSICAFARCFFFTRPSRYIHQNKILIGGLIGHIRMFHCLEVINQRKVNTIWDINFEQCQVIEIPKNLARIFIGEVKKSLTECTAHGLKVLGSKVRVCASTQCGAPKWRLHCVAIGNSHHPHNNPASALLAALDSELAVLKRKLHKTCLLNEYEDSGNTDRKPYLTK